MQAYEYPRDAHEEIAEPEGVSGERSLERRRAPLPHGEEQYQRGESITIEGFTFQVLRADSRKIHALLVDQPKPKEPAK